MGSWSGREGSTFTVSLTIKYAFFSFLGNFECKDFPWWSPSLFYHLWCIFWWKGKDPAKTCQSCLVCTFHSNIFSCICYFVKNGCIKPEIFYSHTSSNHNWYCMLAWIQMLCIIWRASSSKMVALYLQIIISANHYICKSLYLQIKRLRWYCASWYLIEFGFTLWIWTIFHLALHRNAKHCSVNSEGIRNVL